MNEEWQECIIGGQEQQMAKFTKSIRFGLTPGLLWRIHLAAQRRKVSVSELVRTAVGSYLGDFYEQRQPQKRQQPSEPAKTNLSLLDTPVVNWTPEEEERAHKVMRYFRDNDE